jgi:hypothetical protein
MNEAEKARRRVIWGKTLAWGMFSVYPTKGLE